MSTSIYELLRERAAAAPQAPAILAPNREPLSYAACLRLVETTAERLAGFGVGPGDRIAVVLPNGPEMATTFLAVAATATCAPLNPAYRANEFSLYFDDLTPSALIVAAGEPSPSREIAAERGIRIVELTPDLAAPAGTFTLSGDEEAASPLFAGPGDTALVLHTSGTTSRPKMVPLSQANLGQSAANIAESLKLSPADRCLGVMPLFHIHGLIGGVLSTMASGGSMVCMPGFMAPPFFDWLAEYRPTWYTAVPTIHRAVMARAAQLPSAPSTTLRFIRSCSSALPPQLMGDLEKALGVPVIEAYGMTEASHQMACNPLPPEARKPGSVGRATGTRVAIMDEGGRLLAANEVGEIVVRGDSVTAGYADNPEANANSFTDGWFRTGDQGTLDGDGYIFINGRLKEIINRGGSKISPRELDEVLMTHPAVAEAVAFAMPDRRLGEDVGAAIVLRPGATLDERELRAFAAPLLAEYKLPRRVLFLDAIPKGPTGKVERIRLAAMLGITGDDDATPEEAPSSDEPALDDVERRLASVWSSVLRVETIAPQDDFFDAGGDSLSAVCMLTEVGEEFGIELSFGDLCEAPTIQTLARLIGSRPNAPAERRLVRMQPAGSNAPFFAIGAGPTMRDLARQLGGDRPFLSPQYPDFDKLPHPCRLEDIAAYHVATMREEQPHGPYHLGGWCIDGIVAYEAARQLREAGEEVGLLVMFDVPVPFGKQAESSSRAAYNQAEDLARRLHLHASVMRKMRPSQIPSYFAGRIRAVGRLLNRKATQLHYAARVRLNMPSEIRNGLAIQHRASTLYEPRPTDCPLLVFRRSLRPNGRFHDARAGWTELALGPLDVAEIPGDHRAMFIEPQVGITAGKLRKGLAKTDAAPEHAAEPESVAPKPALEMALPK